MLKHDTDIPELLMMMQQFVAIEAVGPSAVRNQGKGVLSDIREYLADLDLDSIPMNQPRFETWLDMQTDGILNAIKVNSKRRPWGTARKAINLFLRACLYNHYLREEYELDTVEEWMEIPLDSVVALALKRKAGRGKLPPWRGLLNLSKEESNRFQSYAKTLTEVLSLPATIHLDIHLWLTNR